ncbi:MAG: type IV pilus biogenesis/stability protein PilW [Candidatus Pelagadaptatus aseana]|uniref:type IV pilus biogenesis/stability protein PilW n=1 Tax=Candidatus Pelagadaptatus aseana TaxID=3120508 RepID=UPI0039B21EB3
MKPSLLTALVMVFALSGCVTTMESTKDPVDEKKAEQSHVDAGFAYLRNNDKESARRHFLKAMSINSSSAGAYNGMAYVYQLDNDMDKADEHFRKALMLDPDNAQARNNYASFLYQKAEYAEAEKHLKKVVSDFTYTRRDMALVNLGRSQLKLGKEDDAVDSLRQAVGLNPRQYRAHIELAEILFERKDYPSSKFYLDQYNKYKRGRPSAASLWLKVRLERIFGNKDQEASAALALKNMYPYSKEYLEYSKTITE